MFSSDSVSWELMIIAITVRMIWVTSSGILFEYPLRSPRVNRRLIPIHSMLYLFRYFLFRMSLIQLFNLMTSHIWFVTLSPWTSRVPANCIQEMANSMAKISTLTNYCPIISTTRYVRSPNNNRSYGRSLTDDKMGNCSPEFPRAIENYYFTCWRSVSTIESVCLSTLDWQYSKDNEQQ